MIFFLWIIAQDTHRRVRTQQSQLSEDVSRASTKIIHELLWEVSFPEWLTISIHGKKSITKCNKRFIIRCDDLSCRSSWTIPHQSSVPKDGSVSFLGMSPVVSCFIQYEFEYSARYNPNLETMHSSRRAVSCQDEDDRYTVQ